MATGKNVENREINLTEQTAGNTASETEVRESKSRRVLSPSYKLKVLSRLDQVKDHGEVGRILRSEGLYSTQISKWRKEREAGALHGLGKKRGKPADTSSARVKLLLKEKAKLEKKLSTANAIIEVQKKVLNLFKEISPESANGET
jgi:transposase